MGCSLRFIYEILQNRIENENRVSNLRVVIEILQESHGDEHRVCNLISLSLSLSIYIYTKYYKHRNGSEHGVCDH